MSVKKKPPTFFNVLIIAAALAAVVPAAAAQPPADDEPSPAATDEAKPRARTEVVLVEASLPYVPTSNTIATKLPLPLRLTPALIGIVEGPLLYDQDVRVLGDALSNVSGINVQTQSGIGDFFLIRGFDSLSSGLVLTDGAAEPEVTYYQTYNVDRVEVLKGPGGFLYGGNPLSGTVNLVRKQPLPGHFVRLGGALGSFNGTESTLDYNISSGEGDFSFRLNSLFRESDHYRDDKESRQVGVNPAFAWRTSERSLINVNMEFVRADYMPDSGLPLFNNAIPGVPRKRSYQSPLDFSEQEIARFQVDWESTVGDNVVLRDKFYVRDLDWQTRGTIFNGVFPDMSGAFQVSRALGELDDRQQFIGNQFEALFTVNAGATRHSFLTGIEVARMADDFTLDAALLPDINLFAPVETTAEPLFFIPGQRMSGDSRSEVASPYVIDQIAFNETFQVLTGLRLDHIDFKDGERNLSRSDTQLSPMAGVVVAPTPTLSLYASGGRSFSPPSARAVGDLRPEKSTQVEVGVKKAFMRGRYQTSAALYQIDRENIAIPDDNGFTQQTGDQRSRGFEFEFAAEPIPRLRTFVAYAYNDSELTEFSESIIVGFDPMTGPIFGTVSRTGNTPVFAPRHLVNVWVSRKFSNGFGVGGGGRYVGDQFIAEDNTFELDSYATLDGAVFYDMDAWRFKLNLKNIADTSYEVRGFGSGSVIPANPFTVFFGVEFRN